MTKVPTFCVIMGRKPWSGPGPIRRLGREGGVSHIGALAGAASGQSAIPSKPSTSASIWGREAFRPTSSKVAPTVVAARIQNRKLPNLGLGAVANHRASPSSGDQHKPTRRSLPWGLALNQPNEDRDQGDSEREYDVVQPGKRDYDAEPIA